MIALIIALTVIVLAIFILSLCYTTKTKFTNKYLLLYSFPDSGFIINRRTETVKKFWLFAKARTTDGLIPLTAFGLKPLTEGGVHVYQTMEDAEKALKRFEERSRVARYDKL